MLSRLVLAAVCLASLASAQDVADGSGEGEVTGADVMGQVMLTAKVLATGMEQLADSFKHKLSQQLDEQIKQIGTYDQVTPAEKKFLQDAQVSAGQTVFGMGYVRKTLVEMARDVVENRLRPIRMMAAKTLNQNSNLRVQQTGVRMTVTRTTQMVHAELVTLRTAQKQHFEAVGEFREMIIHVKNFTSVLQQMANKDGNRYKTMVQQWRDVHAFPIVDQKIDEYWRYVTPTLEKLNKLVAKSGEVGSAVQAQVGALDKFEESVTAAVEKMESTYESYKSGSAASSPIDVDDFNSKHSVYPLELLEHQADKLAHI